MPGIEGVDLAALSTTQFALFSTAQIAALVPGQMPSITTDQLRALTVQQYQAIEANDFGALTTSQVVSLTTSQIQSITTLQARGLQASQLAAVTSAQLVAFEKADLAEMSASAIQGLATSQVLLLTKEQLYRGIGFIDFAIAQTDAMTTTQYAWYTGAQSPLALDLNGDGVKTLSLADGPLFDIDADGDLDRTGWVSAEDGLLVRDLNGNAAIDDGSELFGEATRLPDGNLASQGFEALASLDADGDGQITSSDPAFGTLKVWRDADADGQTDAGELLGLDALGVTALNTRAQVGTEIDQGNLLGLVSSYQTAEGQTRDLVDVWFQVAAPDSLDEKTASLGSALLDFVAPSANAGSEAVLSRDAAAVNQASVNAAAASLGQAINLYQQQTATIDPLAVASQDGRDEMERKRREAANGLLASGAPSLNP
ncbi:MAG: hypothetical protein EBU34_08880 [Alphaproteobacteria bacterium]|nr:hypothetical protein [Alphaproteobacteria bacterium]